jgi:ferrous iron transport protein B
MIVFCIVNLLGQINYQIQNNNRQLPQQNLFEVIGTAITPIFTPIGFEEKTWPATVSMMTGFMAKEIVIGTLLSLQDIKDTKKAISLMDIKEKYYRSIYTIFASKNISTALETNHTGVSSIRKIFPNNLSVLAYLIFIALYLPCSSVFITIGKEIGYKWALVSAIWSTASAYLVAIIFYQIFSLVNRYTTQYNTLFYSIALYACLCFALRVYSRKSLCMNLINK